MAAGLGIAELVAYRRQEVAKVRQMKESGEIQDPVPFELLDCLARPDSYDVDVGLVADRYVVRVIPVPERCLGEGAEARGGGATYEISAQDYSVLSKRYDE